MSLRSQYRGRRSRTKTYTKIHLSLLYLSYIEDVHFRSDLSKSNCCSGEMSKRCVRKNAKPCAVGVKLPAAGGYEFPTSSAS